MRCSGVTEIYSADEDFDRLSGFAGFSDPARYSSLR